MADRHKQSNFQVERRAAVLLATIVNVSRYRPDPPVSPDDYMSIQAEPKKQDKKPKMGVAERSRMADHLRSIFKERMNRQNG